MRVELEQIKRAEQYLGGELNEADQVQFEQDIQQNPGLTEIVENLKLIEQAIVRTELRNQIRNSSGSGGNLTQIVLSVIAIVAVVGGVIWFSSGSIKEQTKTQEKPAVEEKIESTQSDGNEINSITTEKEDKLEVTNDSFRVLTPIQVPKKVKEEESENFTYQIGGHKVWAEPEIQNFKFNSAEGATIEGKDGMLIIVPFNAFIDSMGKPLTGNVKFELIEAFGISEMALLRLKTISNSSMLQSGGMFYLNATISDQQAFINPDKPLYIEIPTIKKDPGMMAFKGDVNSNGDINWIDPISLEKYLVKVDMNDLDFLPPNFEAVATSCLPFRDIKTPTKQIIDSLYYSLLWESDDNTAYTELGERKKARKKIVRSEAYFVSPDAMVRGDSNPAEVTQDKGDLLATFEACGINPSSIETIKTKEFYNSYVSTKEFEKRVKQLHNLDKGNELLDVYIDNLGDDLFIADSLVAGLLEGKPKEIFRQFASERLTNIKDADLYQRRLSIYYKKKRDELVKADKRLAKQFQQKNKEELISLKIDIYKRERKLKKASLPSMSAATAPTYSMRWFNLGWGNIDKYTKLLDKNAIECNILVTNSTPNIEVTQWLKEINTYTDLSLIDGKATAMFPKKTNTNNYKTFVFGISSKGNKYNWGFEKYNPYQARNITLTINQVNLSSIEKDLQELDITWGKIKKHLDWKNQQYNAVVKRQYERNLKREKWRKEKNELIEKYREAMIRQEEERLFLYKLRVASFPCEEENNPIIQSMELDKGVFEYD